MSNCTKCFIENAAILHFVLKHFLQSFHVIDPCFSCSAQFLLVPGCVMISCTKLAHLSLSSQQCWCGLAFRERCPVLWCQMVTSSWHFPVLTLETRWLSSARHNTQHADVSKMSHVAACYCTVVLRDLYENPTASTVIINELKWAA